MPRGDTLHKLVSSDDVTTHRQWMDVVKRLQDDGHKELSLQLLAVVTVATSMRQALAVFHDKVDMPGDALN